MSNLVFNPAVPGHLLAETNSCQLEYRNKYTDCKAYAYTHIRFRLELNDWDYVDLSRLKDIAQYYSMDIHYSFSIWDQYKDRVLCKRLTVESMLMLYKKAYGDKWLTHFINQLKPHI